MVVTFETTDRVGGNMGTALSGLFNIGLLLRS